MRLYNFKCVNGKPFSPGLKEKNVRRHTNKMGIEHQMEKLSLTRNAGRGGGKAQDTPEVHITFSSMGFARECAKHFYREGRPVVDEHGIELHAWIKVAPAFEPH